METAIFVVLIPIGIAFYFLPSLVGSGKKGAGGIFVLNLLLGWTFLGWIIALVWAFSAEPETKPQISSQTASYKKCPDCAETVQGAAVKCRFCGADLSSVGTRVNTNVPVEQLMASGLYAEAEAISENLAGSARSRGDRVAELKNLYALGISQQKLGRNSDAKSTFERAVFVSQRINGLTGPRDLIHAVRKAYANCPK